MPCRIRCVVVDVFYMLVFILAIQNIYAFLSVLLCPTVQIYKEKKI